VGQSVGQAASVPPPVGLAQCRFEINLVVPRVSSRRCRQLSLNKPGVVTEFGMRTYHGAHSAGLRTVASDGHCLLADQVIQHEL